MARDFLPLQWDFVSVERDFSGVVDFITPTRKLNWSHHANGHGKEPNKNAFKYRNYKKNVGEVVED